MWRILAGAILSFALSFATPLLYHGYLSDIMEGMYSDHYTYSFTANERSYYLVPAEYSEWYAFRDGVTENYGKKLFDKEGIVILQGMPRHDFLLKSMFTYYRLKPTSHATYFELEEVENPPVNPYLYLLRYLGIYLSLIIAPVILGFAINKYLLQLTPIWLQITTVASTLLGFVVTCMYLRDWWKLFNCWVLS